MKDLFKNLRKTWYYVKDYKLQMFLYVFLNFLSILINLVIPILSSRIIIYLTDNKFYQLIMISIIIFIVENLRNIIRYLSRYSSLYIYRESFTKLQFDLGSSILKLENKTIDENSSGVFIQRLTNDTSRLSDIFNVLNSYISNILTDLGIFITVFIINKIVFAYLVLVTILLFLIENTRVKKYNKFDSQYRKENEKVSGFVGEIVRGSRDIKMLNSEKSFMKELNTKVVNLNQTRYNMQNIDRRYALLKGFSMDLKELLLIILLVVLIKNDSLNVPDALIIHNYSGRLTSIINYVGMLLDKVKDFNLSSERIFNIMEGKKFKKEKFGKKHLNNIKGNFEFKNVSFGYNDEFVLDKINFKVKANETIAFVGKSGVGKTTIFNLLCKMYTINSGKITIDNIDINELDKDSIRGNITIINQNPYIFNLSIKDNLRLVKDNLTEEEMIEACKIACLDDFVETLPNKYDTIVGEGGVSLSGGQKQRLAIARALIQKTEIILFDEATSALDNETQSKIQNAIDNMKNEYTIMIIAHRLSTIINCDRILFLNNGKIQAQGTHQELLKTCPEYKKLYNSEILKNE